MNGWWQPPIGLRGNGIGPIAQLRNVVGAEKIKLFPNLATIHILSIFIHILLQMAFSSLARHPVGRKHILSNSLFLSWVYTTVSYWVEFPTSSPLWRGQDSWPLLGIELSPRIRPLAPWQPVSNAAVYGSFTDLWAAINSWYKTWWQ